MVHLWHSLIVALTALSLLMGCASSPYVGTEAAVGGGLGALAGAAIGHRIPGPAPWSAVWWEPAWELPAATR